MAADAQSSPGYYPTFPAVRLNRCPVCYVERVPILTDRDGTEFLARCPGCGFEGRFPNGTRSASTVRRWTSAELRRSRRRYDAFLDPEPKLTAAERAAESGDPREEG